MKFPATATECECLNNVSSASDNFVNFMLDIHSAESELMWSHYQFYIIEVQYSN